MAPFLILGGFQAISLGHTAGARGYVSYFVLSLGHTAGATKINNVGDSTFPILCNVGGYVSYFGQFLDPKPRAHGRSQHEDS